MLIRLKILITQDTDWVSRFPGQQHHLAERLVLKGHDIKVIDYDITWKKHKKNELLSNRRVFRHSKLFKDVQIEVIRPGIIKIPIMEYLSMILSYSKEIKNQIKNFKPDVIIGHSILTNYLSMILSKKNHIPFVFHMTDAQHTIIPYKFLRPVGRLIESKILRNSDRVVVINDKLKDYAVNMGANAERTCVVKAGLDFKFYDTNIDGFKIREKYGISKDDFVIFFMGWLYRFSGLKEVAVELSKIKNKKSNIKFLIVGEGDAFDELQEIIEKHDLKDNIILAGRQPYTEIPAYIASSDVCLLPAYNNDIMRNIVPIKLYQYMAMGKPVVSTKLPGVLDEFKTNNGVVYVDKPEDSLYKAIELMESNSIDEHGLKAREFVEKYDWDDVVDEFENILEEIK